MRQDVGDIRQILGAAGSGTVCGYYQLQLVGLRADSLQNCSKHFPEETGLFVS